MYGFDDDNTDPSLRSYTRMTRNENFFPIADPCVEHLEGTLSFF
jgi:hypothetical protein